MSDRVKVKVGDWVEAYVHLNGNTDETTKGVVDSVSHGFFYMTDNDHDSDLRTFHLFEYIRQLEQYEIIAMKLGGFSNGE
jgi:hypothetical protein